MDDDGEQAHLVEVAQRAAEDIDVVCEDGTANLDDGELLRRDGLELREVLLDLTWRDRLRQCLSKRLSSCGCYSRLDPRF